MSGSRFGFADKKSTLVQDAPSGFAKELPPPNVKITSYVLGGKVISINGNTINVNSQRVMVGPNGNFVSNDAKTVTVASSTSIYITSITKGKYSKKVGKVSDIKAGDNINMISTSDIAKMTEFTPDRIEVSR